MCSLEAHRGWLRYTMEEGYRRARACAPQRHGALRTRAICWIVVQVVEMAVNVREGSLGGLAAEEEVECGQSGSLEETTHRAREGRPQGRR